jgi:hypothetical protein
MDKNYGLVRKGFSAFLLLFIGLGLVKISWGSAQEVVTNMTGKGKIPAVIKALDRISAILPNPSDEKSYRSVVLIDKGDPKIFFQLGIQYGITLAATFLPPEQMKERALFSLREMEFILKGVRGNNQQNNGIKEVKTAISDQIPQGEITKMLVGMEPLLKTLAEELFAENGIVNFSFGLWITSSYLDLAYGKMDKSSLQKSSEFCDYLENYYKLTADKIPDERKEKLKRIQSSLVFLKSVSSRVEALKDEDLIKVGQILDGIVKDNTL